MMSFKTHICFSLVLQALTQLNLELKKTIKFHAFQFKAPHIIC